MSHRRRHPLRLLLPLPLPLHLHLHLPLRLHWLTFPSDPQWGKHAVPVWEWPYCVPRAVEKAKARLAVRASLAKYARHLPFRCRPLRWRWRWRWSWHWSRSLQLPIALWPLRLLRERQMMTQKMTGQEWWVWQALPLFC
jgi:hypothetical protein